MLSELLEDYKDTNDIEQKELLLQEFKDLLWTSKYTFKKFKKKYTYKINKESLNNRNDLISLFEEYNNIEITYCKSYYSKKLQSIDYIRIHINNMFGYLVDKNVYLPKEYYQLLLTPKKEYFSVIKQLKNGENVDSNTVRYNIETSLLEAEQIKQLAFNNKIELKWGDYKKLINAYIDRLFDNYIPPHEYEKEHGWKLKVIRDGWNEDNYLVKYFCVSLTGYMRNYVRDVNVVKEKHCVSCGDKIIVNNMNQKYCETCCKNNWRRYNALKQKEYRKSRKRV